MVAKMVSLANTSIPLSIINDRSLIRGAKRLICIAIEIISTPLNLMKTYYRIISHVEIFNWLCLRSYNSFYYTYSNAVGVSIWWTRDRSSADTGTGCGTMFIAPNQVILRNNRTNYVFVSNTHQTMNQSLACVRY